MSAFFDVRDLAVHIGSTAILHNINLAFNEGQVTALARANPLC
jgi:iron complex transport system ATP-binding protein